ncbi:PAS domain-containing protein [Chromobacterium phragmitis]
MFNLEPLDIARLVRQQDAAFESIYEGVISVDTRRRLTAINRAARTMLELGQPRHQLAGQSLGRIAPDGPFLALEADAPDVTDEIYLFGGLPPGGHTHRRQAAGLGDPLPPQGRHQLAQPAAQPGQALRRQPARDPPRAPERDIPPVRPAAHQPTTRRSSWHARTRKSISRRWTPSAAC